MVWEKIAADHPEPLPVDKVKEGKQKGREEERNREKGKRAKHVTCLRRMLGRVRSMKNRKTYADED